MVRDGILVMFVRARTINICTRASAREPNNSLKLEKKSIEQGLGRCQRYLEDSLIPR